MTPKPYAAALTFALTLAIHRGDTIAARVTRDMARLDAWRAGVPVTWIAAFECVSTMTIHRRLNRAVKSRKGNTPSLASRRGSGSLSVDGGAEVNRAQRVQPI